MRIKQTVRTDACDFGATSRRSTSMFIVVVACNNYLDAYFTRATSRRLVILDLWSRDRGSQLRALKIPQSVLGFLLVASTIPPHGGGISQKSGHFVHTALKYPERILSFPGLLFVFICLWPGYDQRNGLKLIYYFTSRMRSIRPGEPKIYIYILYI